MSKYSYLSRVTTPEVSTPFLKIVMKKVRNRLDRMISIHLTDGQWNQCCLKGRQGGVGIIDLPGTANGAYYASLLECLQNISCLDKAQGLGLGVPDGSPSQTNMLSTTIIRCHSHMSTLYDSYRSIQHCNSINTIKKLDISEAPSPGMISIDNRLAKLEVINANAAIMFPTIQQLAHKPKKLKSTFSEYLSIINRQHILSDASADAIVRIDSASDEDSTLIAAIPTSPERCFTNDEFKVLLFLRLGIPKASLNSYCSDCKNAQLSNVHLANGCPHHGYTQKKHDGIKFLLQDMCKSARL